MTHAIVTQKEWLAARTELLQAEKALTRQRDELSQRRRELPWVRVEKPYVFQGPTGQETLADLFGGRSQLIVYHFMFGPEWAEGCPGCSFLMDHVEGALAHLKQHDVSLVVVSRAPLEKLQAFQKRMGWSFKWVSSYGSDFNYDFHVSFTEEEKAKGSVYYNYEVGQFPSDEMTGTSVFYKNAAGEVFHTYSTYARGGEMLLGTYHLLDMTPKGRDEKKDMMDWLRHHDRYDDAVGVAAGCGCAEAAAR